VGIHAGIHVFSLPAYGEAYVYVYLSYVHDMVGRFMFPCKVIIAAFVVNVNVQRGNYCPLSMAGSMFSIMTTTLVHIPSSHAAHRFTFSLHFR